MDEVETVFQYYTIVDPLLTSELVEDDSMCFQDENSCDSKPEIMYLLQEEIGENSLDIKSDNELTESADTEDTTMVAPFKVITLQNGQVLMTETSSLDEIQIHGDDTNEGFREVELEDGSRAFIENKLWTSFTTEDASRTDDNASGDETLLEIKTKLVKKFPCLYAGCEKVYSSLQHLTVHVRSHTGSKPYHCTFVDCRKAFATGYSLKSHQRSHSEEKPYGCLICTKHFKTSGDLQKHVRTHTGERPFVCPVTGCERRFTTSNIRKVHVRSHTGERPYTCEYPACGKAFASATNYKNHVRIHTGEKPYICGVEGCNKRFTEYSSLHKHNVVHTNNKPFKCNICGQLCKLESSIRNHKRIVHNVIMKANGAEIFVEDLNGNLNGELIDRNVATSSGRIAEEVLSGEDEFIIP